MPFHCSRTADSRLRNGLVRAHSTRNSRDEQVPIGVIFDINVVNVLSFLLVVRPEFRCQNFVVLAEDVISREGPHCTCDVIERATKAATSQKAFYKYVMPCRVSN